MNTTQTTTGTRQAAVTGLAVVGFVALVVAGIWLAVYSTRFVPTVVNRIGAAAVFLGSVFTPSPAPGLSVISTVSSTTIPFDNPVASTTSSTTTEKTPAANRTPVVDTTPSVLHPVGGNTSPAVAPYGLADLTVSVLSIGYVTAFSQDSYVESATIPSGSYPAIKIRVKNIGTNWSGTWRLSASFPSTQTFESDSQQSIPPTSSPDSYSDFVLWSSGRINSGQNQSSVTVTVNFDNAVPESNTSNNSATATLLVN